VAQAANISVSVGLDQALVTLPMVSKLVETSINGRVMRITGQYVAFSEDKHFIQADQQVRLKYKGVTLEANSVQVDIDGGNIKALGKVQIASDDKTLVGERLWLDLKTFEGYIQAVGTRKWFSAFGLTDLPERPKNLNPEFDLVDLADSKLIWVGKQANYIVGERVQVQNARAYVGGIKAIRMPFHQADLSQGFGETEQYVGVGTQGLTVDLPLYLRMTPGSSTALRFGYGSESDGIGHFTRNRGLSIDLVQKYGFEGASQGQAMFTNLSSINGWGFNWDHTQQLSKSTRLVTNLQLPEHRDFYGVANLTSGLPIGTFQASVGANMLHQTGQFAKALSFAFETKPKALASNKLSVSAVTTFHYQDAQEVRVGRGLKIPTLQNQYQTFGIKLRPAAVNLGSGFTLDSSATLQSVFGNQNQGFGPALETNIRKALPRNGYVGFGLRYNSLGAFDSLIPVEGKLNGTFNLMYPVTNRLKIMALADMALDAPSRHSIIQANYQLTDKWRFEMLHTLFKFGEFGNYDYELGVARALGNRELALYWSRREHRWMVQFGAARF
jgi:hypothetical protein